MCHVYGELFINSVKGSDFKKFTIARFARVYPLHFVTLTYTIILLFVSAKLGIPKNIILEVENNAGSIFSNLLLIHSMNLHQWFSWVHASWSISVEWWAYMLFPFLVAPFSRLNSIGKIVISTLCIVGYLAIMFYLIPLVKIPPALMDIFGSSGAPMPGESLNVSFQFGFLRCLCGFILGMIMCQGYKAEWGKRVLGNGYTLITLALCSFTCMHFALPDVFAVAFFPFILLSAAYGSAGMNKFFGNPILQRLGDWSFSLYLVHQPLLFTINKIMAYLNPIDPTNPPMGPPPRPDMLMGWIYCFGIIGLALFISYLTFNFIERPARKFINPVGSLNTV